MAARGLFLKGGMAMLLTTAAGILAVAPAAAAHSPYIVPFSFSPERDYVGVEGGMAEDHYFIPDFAIRGGAGDWQVTGPDGAVVKVAPTNLKSVNVVDAPLPTEGTYKISTGERAGRSGKSAKVDGVWRTIRPAPPPGAPAQPAGPPRPMEGGDAARGTGPINAADVPPGAEMIETQGYLLAETYVTRGVPTPGALKPTGTGFEIEPVTHPSEVFLDEGFTFRALIDGKPVAGLAVTVNRGGERYDASHTSIEAVTGPDGKATIRFAKPGAYVLNTRYPGPAAPGAAPNPKSWTYSLSFEVTQ